MGEERDRPPDPAVPEALLWHYTSADEDSARWWDFAFRAGDIVVSTRSKSGTTWVQMICLLLVFADPELPDRLGRLSPWLDWLVEPKNEVFARLAAQTHRRVIKTHTPLDGVPLDDRATYIVVGRHPLDMAVSLYHHRDNIDRRRMAELTGQPEMDRPPQPTLHQWLVRFIAWDGDARSSLDTLPGTMLHLSDAWARRHNANVVLVHYDDLLADLDGSMRRLADLLGIAVDEEGWPALVRAATFESMRAVADVPDADLGVLRDPAAFFRRGRSGEGRALLQAGQMAGYRDRVAAMAPDELLAWLERDQLGSLSMPIVPDDKDWTWVLERPCPECGFDAPSVPPESVGALLRANAASWEGVLRKPDDVVRRRPADDVWAPLEYACHVRDVCTLYHERLDLMLREDDPLYPNWDQDATAAEERYDAQDPPAVARQLRDAAAGLADAFDSVRGEQWFRTGRRSDGARFSIAGFSRYLLHDPVHHLHDVTVHRGS